MIDRFRRSIAPEIASAESDAFVSIVSEFVGRVMLPLIRIVAVSCEAAAPSTDNVEFARPNDSVPSCETSGFAIPESRSIVSVSKKSPVLNESLTAPSITLPPLCAALPVLVSIVNEKFAASGETSELLKSTEPPFASSPCSVSIVIVFEATMSPSPVTENIAAVPFAAAPLSSSSEMF